MNYSEHLRKLEAARLRILRPLKNVGPDQGDCSFPYYGDGVVSLTFLPREDCPTLSVDRYWRVSFNPEVIQKATLEQCAAFEVHEMLHPLLDHFGRAERLGVTADTMRRWNIAADLEIHSCERLQRLLSNTEDTVGFKGVFPSDFNLPYGKLAEFYFSRLENHPKLSDSSPLEQEHGGSGVSGIPAPWEVGAPEESSVPGIPTEDGRMITRRVAAEVSNSSKARGEVPAGILSRFQDISNPPKADWKQILRQHTKDAATWVRGHTRKSYRQFSWRQAAMAQKGMVPPGRESPEPNITMVIDTSGSMGQAVTDQCCAEMKGILGSFSRKPAVVLTVDSVAGEVQRVRRVEDVVLTGGGGTDMRVGIQEAIKQTKPNIIVVLTDGYTPWPSQPAEGVKIIACLVGTTRDSTPDWMPSVMVDV